MNVKSSHGGPIALTLGSRVVMDFASVEDASYQHFRNIWTNSTAIRLGVVPGDYPDFSSLLDSPYSRSEVVEALLSLRPKAICCDYKIKQVRSVVAQAEKGILRASRNIDILTRQIGALEVVHSHIAVIPKVSTVPTPTQLRPIGCVPLNFKIERRITCNRILSVLPRDLHPCNFTYRRGRSLQYVLIAIEAFFGIPDNCYHGVFSADAVKAYDNLSHTLLDDVLQ
eukprot:PhF_6_TR20102/c0_g1_i1/m.29254